MALFWSLAGWWKTHRRYKLSGWAERRISYCQGVEVLGGAHRDEKTVGPGLSRQESGVGEFRWPALKSLLSSMSLRYNIIHEKSCPARNAPFRPPSIRRRRIVRRRGRPVGFGAGGAKEDVAVVTRDPHYRNFQAGPLAALFFCRLRQGWSTGEVLLGVNLFRPLGFRWLMGGGLFPGEAWQHQGLTTLILLLSRSAICRSEATRFQHRSGTGLI